MAQKAILFGDFSSAKRIIRSNNPKEQKALGRLIKGFNEDIWNQHKFDIMVKGLLLKFEQNPSLKRELLSTGSKILVEGSPYDKIWGVGLKYDNPLILDDTNWQGENLLGKALMRAREKLKNN